MKKLLSLLAAILLVLFVLGCSEDDENPASSNNPTLSGSWMGKGMLVGVTVVHLEANLSQSGTTVSGSSSIYGVAVVGQDTLACTVTGNNNYPNVNLTSTAQGQGGIYKLTFTGAFVNSDSLNGTFKDEGSGVSYPMGIKKQ